MHRPGKTKRSRFPSGESAASNGFGFSETPRHLFQSKYTLLECGLLMNWSICPVAGHTTRRSRPLSARSFPISAPTPPDCFGPFARSSSWLLAFARTPPPSAACTRATDRPRRWQRWPPDRDRSRPAERKGGGRAASDHIRCVLMLAALLLTTGKGDDRGSQHGTVRIKLRDLRSRFEELLIL